MSASLALSDAVLARLRSDAGVVALVAQRIWDHAPERPAYPHITLGPSDAVPDDADCIAMRTETIQIDVWGRDQGKKWPTRVLVDAVKRALHDRELDLGSGARAVLRVMLMRVLPDPDGITTHGVLQVEAVTEEEADG